MPINVSHVDARLFCSLVMRVLSRRPVGPDLTVEKHGYRGGRNAPRLVAPRVKYVVSIMGCSWRLHKWLAVVAGLQCWISPHEIHRASVSRIARAGSDCAPVVIGNNVIDVGIEKILNVVVKRTTGQGRSVWG